MLEYYRQTALAEVALPSSKELAEGLVAEEILLSPDGRVVVNYGDATELFADHSIEASLDANGAFVDFALQG